MAFPGRVVDIRTFTGIGTAATIVDLTQNQANFEGVCPTHLVVANNGANPFLYSFDDVSYATIPSGGAPHPFPCGEKRMFVKAGTATTSGSVTITY